MVGIIVGAFITEPEKCDKGNADQGSVALAMLIASRQLTALIGFRGFVSLFGSRVAGNEPKRGRVSHSPTSSWGDQVHRWQIGSQRVRIRDQICNLQDGHAQAMRTRRPKRV